MRDPLSRDVTAAVMLVIFIAILLIMATAIFRFIVPSILEAHFYGSVLAASATGLAGFVGLIETGFLMFKRVARLFTSNGDDLPEKENHD